MASTWTPSAALARKGLESERVSARPPALKRASVGAQRMVVFKCAAVAFGKPLLRVQMVHVLMGSAFRPVRPNVKAKPVAMMAAGVFAVSVKMGRAARRSAYAPRPRVPQAARGKSAVTMGVAASAASAPKVRHVLMAHAPPIHVSHHVVPRSAVTTDAAAAAGHARLVRHALQANVRRARRVVMGSSAVTMDAAEVVVHVLRVRRVRQGPASRQAQMPVAGSLLKGAVTPTS